VIRITKESLKFLEIGFLLSLSFEPEVIENPFSPHLNPLPTGEREGRGGKFKVQSLIFFIYLVYLRGSAS
jgi:hypothetical protein